MRFDEWTWDALTKGLTTLTARELWLFGTVFVLSISVLYVLCSLGILWSRLRDLQHTVQEQGLAVEAREGTFQEAAVDELKAAVQEAVEALEAAADKLDVALAKDKSGDV